MEYSQVARLLEHPAARLLRLDSAAFVLAFLQTAFHEAGGVSSVADESLLARLERWLAERREEESFSWERTARDYLDEWCSDRAGWLRKTAPAVGGETALGGSGAHFELTAATEKALGWVEGLRGAERFVGTESRLEGIFRELDALLRDSSGDVPARLERLRAERAALDAEIAGIEATGTVRTLEGWQVNERYARVLEAARTLVGDFRQVEENFRQLAQEIVRRRTEADGTKGELLGGVLDSHDAVRDSPQGRSFYGFGRLLLDPDRRERFEQQVAAAEQLPALDPELRADPSLPRLLPRLRAEQDRVSTSAQRLTGNLRRALESARLAERRRVRALVSEIQRLALAARDDPPRREGFLEVEELPEIYAGMSRPPWDEAAAPVLDAPLVGADGTVDLDTLRLFQNLPHLTLEVLERNVAACLAGTEIVLLTEVLRRFPPEHGLLETLGYVILALRDPKRHYVTRETDTVALPDGGRWRLPRVVFCRHAPVNAAADEPTPPIVINLT